MRRVPIVHVVDDDEMFQIAISRLLNAAGYEARSYQNAGHFLLAKIEDGPGCILMDMCMPGPSGLDLQQVLSSRGETLPIIFLSGFGDVPTTVRALKQGAEDFLTKPVQRVELLVAVEKALVRQAEASLVKARVNELRARYEALTPRELQVFEGVVEGKLNKEIAAELGAAERTIKAHRAQVMGKMKVDSVAQLVHMAERLRGDKLEKRP